MPSTSLKEAPAAPAPQPDGIDYRARVRKLAPLLEASASDIERGRELPQELVDGLVEAGLFRLLLPRSLDGAELLPLQYVPIIEDIARIDASAAWCLNQNSGCSMTAAYLAPPAAKEIFGGPRGILAWGPGPGEARMAPGGYRVTATWAFASGSHHASWLGCHVPVLDADGTPQLDKSGTPIVKTMLFPKTSTRFTDIWHTLGLRGTGSDQFSVSDLFVPEEFSLHAPSRGGDAVRREPGLLYCFSNLQLYAAGFGAVAMGIARSTLESFIELARDKIPRGARATLRDNHMIQLQVAHAEARLDAARAYLMQSLADATDGAAQRGELTLDERMAIRLAASFAIEQSVEVVDMVYQAAGATAIFNIQPFERRFRDIHTVAQQLQGRQEHFETVGKHLMGLEADTSWL
ncbi:MAG TPA: acyl-CoA dehydrogenase family protein [Stellaceae bacterium]|nr:acyl-CoA dehydrogenase family protein [Stellaceae bacterium]